MKRAVFLVVMLLMVFSACDNRSPYYHLVMGKWSAKDSLTELVYEFKQDRFERLGSYDTQALNVEGAYFINENKDRHTVTLSLLPDVDVPYGPEYSVMMPVENMDIVSINGERMVVVRSKYIDGKLGNTFQNKNDTLWRIED